ncbi:hypothetical protein EDC04DRAFT_2741545 [Pisolithus marmoratus]|nr:hypothetical protein EDC04DRAFT_2741545 [Pisolithus marmoratus]
MVSIFRMVRQSSSLLVALGTLGPRDISSNSVKLSGTTPVAIPCLLSMQVIHLTALKKTLTCSGYVQLGLMAF